LLIDASFPSIPFASADVERLYSLLEYGTMSTIEKFGTPDIDFAPSTASNMDHLLAYDYPMSSMDGEGMNTNASATHLPVFVDGELSSISQT
jgi:hypothetical protein